MALLPSPPGCSFLVALLLCGGALASEPRDDKNIIRNWLRYGAHHPYYPEGRRAATAADVIAAARGEDPAARRALNGADPSLYSNMRIVPYFDDTQITLDARHESFLKNDLIPAAIRFFGKALKVVPVVGNLHAERTCLSSYPSACARAATTAYCGDVAMPTAHLKPLRVCSTCYGDGSCTGCTFTEGGDGVPDADYVLCKFPYPNICAPTNICIRLTSNSTILFFQTSPPSTMARGSAARTPRRSRMPVCASATNTTVPRPAAPTFAPRSSRGRRQTGRTSYPRRSTRLRTRLVSHRVRSRTSATPLTGAHHALCATPTVILHSRRERAPLTA